MTRALQAEVQAMQAIERALAKADDLPDKAAARVRKWAAEQLASPGSEEDGR